MTQVLGYQSDVQGVFSIWSNPASRFDQRRRSPESESPSNKIAGNEGEPLVDDPILAAAQRFSLQQLDKFFLAITNAEDGFRISGALTHVPDMEESK